MKISAMSNDLDDVIWWECVNYRCKMLPIRCVQFYHRSKKEVVHGRYLCQFCEKGEELYQSTKDIYPRCGICGLPIDVGTTVCSSTLCKKKNGFNEKDGTKEKQPRKRESDGGEKVRYPKFKSRKTAIDLVAVTTNEDEHTIQIDAITPVLENTTESAHLGLEVAMTIHEEITIECCVVVKRNLRFPEIEDSPIFICECGENFKSYRMGGVIVRRVCQDCVHKRTRRGYDEEKSKHRNPKSKIIKLDFNKYPDEYDALLRESEKLSKSIEEYLWDTIKGRYL